MDLVLFGTLVKKKLGILLGFWNWQILKAFQLKKKNGTNLKKNGMKRNGDYFHNFNTPVLFFVFTKSNEWSRNWWFLFTNYDFLDLKVDVSKIWKNIFRVPEICLFSKNLWCSNLKSQIFWKRDLIWPPKNSSLDCFFA